MPRVVDEHGKELANVDDELYKDFFFDMLFGHEASWDIVDYLKELDPTPRLYLSRYIVERLAEVDPGHLPKAIYD